jgi:hypothetical protein
VGPPRSCGDHPAASDLDKAHGRPMCIRQGGGEAVDRVDELPVGAEGSDRGRQVCSGQVRRNDGKRTRGPAAHEQGSPGEQCVERRRRADRRPKRRAVGTSEEERGGGRPGEGAGEGGHRGADEE